MNKVHFNIIFVLISDILCGLVLSYMHSNPYHFGANVDAEFDQKQNISLESDRENEVKL